VRALPMILSNYQPKTKDVSDALNERALVIPFHHRIAGSDKSDKRRARMFDELPGIMVRFVAGIRRLRKRGEWLIPLDCREAFEQWAHQANTLNAFKNDCIFADPESHIIPKECAIAYKHWIIENETTKGSSHGLGRNTLFENLDNMLGVRVDFGHKKMVWNGWRLQSPLIGDVEAISETDSAWDDSDD